MLNENEKIQLTLDEVVSSADNVGVLLTKAQQDTITEDVIKYFENDYSTLDGWFQKYDASMELAMQVLEHTTFPWEGASNIKYPLIVIAALGFNARAYPALMNGISPVKGKVIGTDRTGQKTKVATAVEKHMNYQLLHGMDDWEEEMDKLLVILPIIGCAFKKTFRNLEDSKNVSKLILPKHLILNYYTEPKNWEKCRKTEIFEDKRNDVVEKFRRGLYLEHEFMTSELGPIQAANDKLHRRVREKLIGQTEPENDEDTPFTQLEHHGFYDLDGDGYAEPYVITVNYDHRKLLRIVPRYEVEDIEYNNAGEVVRILPTEFYTKFPFIPNPEGGIYDVGFGHLLGPLNEAANAAFNQLMNAGVLANLQSGFIGRSARVTAKTMRLKPGEWRLIGTRGSALKDNIFPLPAREPNAVMLQLLQLMLSAGQTISSTTDLMVGETQPHNQKATTTNVVREESMRIFTAIYKRIRKALGKEYRKLFLLNSRFEDGQTIDLILDDGLAQEANIYDPSVLDVFPAADPTIALKEQKIQLYGTVLEIGKQYGNINMVAAERELLDAMEVPALDTIMPMTPEGESAMPPPPPPIEMLELKEETEARTGNQILELIKILVDEKMQGQELGIKESDLVLKLTELMKPDEPAGTTQSNK